MLLLRFCYEVLSKVRGISSLETWNLPFDRLTALSFVEGEPGTNT